MATNGVAVTVKQAIAGVTFENALHFFDSDDHTPTEWEQIVSTAWVADGSFAQVVQTTDVDYLGVNVRDIDGEHDGVDVAWSNAINSGQVAEETVPISLSMLYSLRTEHAGKVGKGRIYIAGVRHSLYAAEQLKWNLSGSSGLEVAPAGAVFAAAVADAGVTTTLAVFSRKNDAVYPVTDVLPRTLFGEQRRRSGRVTP